MINNSLRKHMDKVFKNVKAHLKDDIRESKKSIKEDKKLIKKISNKGKRK